MPKKFSDHSTKIINFPPVEDSLTLRLTALLDHLNEIDKKVKALRNFVKTNKK